MSHLLHIPTGSENLPSVGSAAFNELISRSTDHARRRQPVVEERVPVDVQRERDLVDMGLSQHNQILQHLERVTAKR